MSTTGEAANVDGFSQLAISAPDRQLPFSVLKSCNECDPPKCRAVSFCSACKTYLCKHCDLEVVHASKTTRKHQRMEIDLYVKVRRCLGSSSPTDGQIEADNNNALCCVNPVDQCIILHPRLVSLVPDPNARPSLVAFVGPTGVGKSTLMRMLVSLDGDRDEVDMPLAGGTKDAISTSADLHMYGADQVPAHSAYPLLYVDSEGQNGSEEPRAIPRLWKAFANVYKEKLGAYDNFKNNRLRHVEHSYPRLLYIFSDVICFVFTGDWREKKSILNPLLEWVQKAAFGAVNQHRPQLFLIFNKRGEEALDQDYDDFRKTYEIWIQGVDKETRNQLQCYYSDPQVCLIPEMANSPSTYLSRVNKLREEIMHSTKCIRTSREKANQLFTRTQLQQYMQLAVNSFNENPTCDFDIYKESMARRPTFVGLAKYIFEFFRAVEQANSACTKNQRYQESLSILRERFKCSVRLWNGRLKLNMPSGPEAKLPQYLQADLEKAQRWIDGELPCAAVVKGVDGHTHQCDTVRRMHSDDFHASTDARAGSAVRWVGAFTEDPEVQAAVDAPAACNLVDIANIALRNETMLDVKAIRKQLIEVSKSERVKYPSWFPSFMSYQVCVSCMLELPTEVLSLCGHIICANCAKEEAETHSPEMSCPVCLSPAQWYPKDLPPLAGYRILSLDGGGIRGIVELLSLQEVMSFFPETHIEDLFDIIAGTSTGGIIALALTVHELNEKPMRLRKVIKLFQELSENIFSSEMLRPFARHGWTRRLLQFLRVYDTKYRNDNLLELLKKHFGEESLLSSCVGGPRVIVTACARDDNLNPVWFTSYNRPMSENECNDLFQETTGQSTCEVAPGRVFDNHMFTPKDAAAATSAAGTYFPAYKAGRRFWVDGGLRHNCPADVAIQEARTIWPNRKASALISLGCARLSTDEQPKNSDSLMAVVNGLKIVALDAEAQSRAAIYHLKQVQPDFDSCGLRLNPTITVSNREKYNLDHAKKIPALKEMTETYLRSDGRACVQEAANLLWAALFYLEAEIDEVLQEPKLDKLCIRSRAALHGSLKDALTAASRSSPPPFSVECNRPNAKAVFSWAQCAWDHGVMKLPFELSGFPRVGRVTVTVNLHMCLPETSAPEGWFLPISGMPCDLVPTDW